MRFSDHGEMAMADARDAEKSALKDPEKEVDWRWLQMPAVFCDTFVVSVWGPPGIVRLTFAEFTDNKMLPFFRTAVVLPIADAKALARELDEQIRAAEMEAAAENKPGQAEK
jgi:hypothetical protein